MTWRAISVSPWSEDVRARLLQHLPEEHRSSQELETLINTPQFKSQLERFSHALQSGQMDLAQFGLSSGTGFGVADFLQAIQSQVEAEGTEGAADGAAEGTEPSGDNPDTMAE
jgi:26S proteasome regulatory subunit N13